MLWVDCNKVGTCCIRAFLLDWANSCLAVAVAEAAALALAQISVAVMVAQRLNAVSGEGQIKMPFYSPIHPS